MRLVAGALALVLFAPIARAEDTMTSEPARSIRPAEDPTGGPAHGKVPLRVVRILAESHQALLFDRTRATHVLAEIGGKLEGYTVDDIDDDAVTLSRDGRQIVLVAPPRAGRRRRDAVRDRDAVQVRPAPARPSDTAEPAPIDPYDDAAALRVVEAPGAPHAPAAPGPAPAVGETGDAGIRVAHAVDAPASRPVVAGEGGIRVVEAPGAAPPAALAPAAAAPTPPASPAAMSIASAGAAPDPGHLPAPEAASPGIRVVTAPSGPAPSSPAAPASSRVAGAPAAPPPAIAGQAAAPPPFPAVPPPAAAPAALIHPAPAASVPDKQAPDQALDQALDARALADVMTGGGRARGPHPLTADPPATAAAHPVTAAPAAPAETRPGDAVVISRGELDRALADFAGLTAALRGRFSAAGVAIESVGEGTIFQRAGLRAGDVITSVDGVRLRTLDDAANLYARASTARAVTAQVLRGGKPVTIHVVIQ